MDMTPDCPVPVVSVIVPVWNPGPGIDRCIDSLQNQTLREIEMIFVDDRGSDGAMEKVKAAAAEDPRIRILTNPRNLGPGPSRNAGIASVRGKYLSFMDADDYAAPDFLELLYHAALSEEADIAKGCCVYIEKDNSRVERTFSLNQKIREGLSLNRPLFVLFTYEHWTGLYRKELFENKEVHYGSTRRDQDTRFLLGVCSFAKNIILCDDALYYYRRRSDSAFNTIARSSLADLAKSFDEQMDCILSLHAEDKYSENYVLNMINRRMMIFFSLKNGFRYEPDEIAFLNSIMKTLRRFPGWDNLKKKSLSVRILMEYQICLPNGVFKLPWKQHADTKANLRLACGWVRFMSVHPRYFLVFMRKAAGHYGKRLKKAVKL
jgi:glycosyltransferase involved in cell wall biosynthesis